MGNGPWGLYQNDGNLVFTDVTVDVGITDTTHYLTHGVNWGDVNNDGWLDLYICNYEQELPGVHNYFYLSDADGTFTECANLRGFSDGQKYSFQGTFFDLNMDGWQYLYIINQ